MKKKIEQIIESSILTGSRVFGGVTEGSDYDYIVHRSAFSLCWEVLKVVNYERLAYNSKEMISYLFKWDYKKVNLLIAKPGHYHRWVNATKKMKKLKDQGVIFRDKVQRVHAFNSYKDYNGE